MPAIYEYRHTVEEAEIDAQGRVNNLEYLKWMQAAAIAHSAAQGWPAERYQEIGGGWVVRSHFIEYRQPAFAGDEIVVKTWVANFHKITSLRRYRIVRARTSSGDDATLLAIAETDWAFIGLKHGVPRRIPQELIVSFEVVLEEAES